MTKRNQIENLFDAFFEFPTDDKSHVTSTSCKLFAEHCVQKVGKTPLTNDRIFELWRDACTFVGDQGDIVTQGKRVVTFARLIEKELNK
jgi:hypothetical protein